MKTAISVPDDIFEEAEALARSQGVSRSQIYAAALRAYLELARDEQTTIALNAIYGEQRQPDEFLRRAAKRNAERNPWP